MSKICTPYLTEYAFRRHDQERLAFVCIPDIEQKNKIPKVMMLTPLAANADDIRQRQTGHMDKSVMDQVYTLLSPEFRA